MKLYGQDRRCKDISDYIFYLNKRVGENANKQKLTDNDKLAVVFLFNLEHYPRYKEAERLTYTLYILDNYSKIVQDDEDIFKRNKIVFNVPKNAKKILFKEYREYINAVKTVANSTEEELEDILSGSDLELPEEEETPKENQPKKVEEIELEEKDDEGNTSGLY